MEKIKMPSCKYNGTTTPKNHLSAFESHMHDNRTDVAQGKTESLRDFITRLNKEATSIPNMSQEVVLLAMQSSLLPGLAFKEYMGRKNLKTLVEALGKRPPRVTTSNLDPKKRCDFHRDKGHTTEECIHLKNSIEDLIKRGYLSQFKQYSRQDSRGERSKQEKKDKEKRELGDVLVISGGPMHGGTVSRARADLRDMVHQVNYNECRKWPPPSPPQPKVVFDEQDQYGVIYPHDDLLVVAIIIANWKVRKVLVDGRSSANIMFIEAFCQMHQHNKDLKRVNYEVTRFDGLGMIPEGIIELSVQVGEGAQARNVRAEFLAINS
ncbi:uncharacterized protein LOC110702849 [Chenopodium quinoa]|uniref:uncharacterized protein LOC110702849 n=1 Tax=Chenopodium quinoa TaxID=63459 RepID=UPI000B7842F8|nr:uncharacterized protein LOC110702849 [Chenopodium quinoa]